MTTTILNKNAKQINYIGQLNFYFYHHKSFVRIKKLIFNKFKQYVSINNYIDPYINFCLVKFDCTLIQPLPKHYTCSTPKWLPFGCYLNDSIDL